MLICNSFTDRKIFFLLFCFLHIFQWHPTWASVCMKIMLSLLLRFYLSLQPWAHVAFPAWLSLINHFEGLVLFPPVLLLWNNGWPLGSAPQPTDVCKRAVVLQCPVGPSFPTFWAGTLAHHCRLGLSTKWVRLVFPMSASVSKNSSATAIKSAKTENHLLSLSRGRSL